MLTWRFVLKVMNNERKILTHHGIIDHIAQQIVSVITQVCKESKLWIHPNLRSSNFSFTYSFKFIYFCIVDVRLRKRTLFKKIGNHSQPLKLQQNIRFVTNLWKNWENLWKLHIQLEILSYLAYGPKSLNMQGFDTQAKIDIFYQLVLLSNNLVLMSY